MASVRGAWRSRTPAGVWDGRGVSGDVAPRPGSVSPPGWFIPAPSALHLSPASVTALGRSARLPGRPAPSLQRSASRGSVLHRCPDGLHHCFSVRQPTASVRQPFPTARHRCGSVRRRCFAAGQPSSVARRGCGRRRQVADGSSHVADRPRVMQNGQGGLQNGSAMSPDGWAGCPCTI